MFWIYLTIAVVAAILVFSLIVYWIIRWLSKIEPYATFIKMRTRHKINFFRLLLRDKDKQVPLYVKFIPVILVVYLSIPFDLIPDFVPVLGYLDDIAIALFALVLVIKLTPRQAVLDFLSQAQSNASRSEESDPP